MVSAASSSHRSTPVEDCCMKLKVWAIFSIDTLKLFSFPIRARTAFNKGDHRAEKGSDGRARGENLTA